MKYILLIILFSFFAYGCSVIDYMACGDAGVESCSGFLCMDKHCLGEEYNPETKKWGRKNYNCGMWRGDNESSDLICVDKDSENYNIPISKAKYTWRY